MRTAQNKLADDPTSGPSATAAYPAFIASLLERLGTTEGRVYAKAFWTCTENTTKKPAISGFFSGDVYH